MTEQPIEQPLPTASRRRFIRGTVGVAGGLTAAHYVKPEIRSLGVPTALAVSSPGGATTIEDDPLLPLPLPLPPLPSLLPDDK